MEIKCAMIKLKPNSLEKVRQWAKTMNNRKDEALQTIKNEGVELESVFLTNIAGDDYLVYYMRLENVAKAQEVVKASLMEIDAIHQQFKQDCWAKISEVELLLDVENKL